MGFVTKAEAYIISELKSTVMDRLHMGGSFLQQVPTVTVGGLPVAIREGGGLGALGGQLGGIIGQIQDAAGQLSNLVENPMGALESAIGDQISGLTSTLGDAALTSVLSGGQLSSLTTALGNMQTSFSSFQTHTSQLSGLTESVSDSVPDLKKLMNTGNTLKSLGTDTADDFIKNTASALFADDSLQGVTNKLQLDVARNLNLIKTLDPVANSSQISTLVSETITLLNNQKSTLDDIRTADVNNFANSVNKVEYATSAIGLASQFADTDSVTYSLFNKVGKGSVVTSLSTALDSATLE
jgi:hypothetical protein